MTGTASLPALRRRRALFRAAAVAWAGYIFWMSTGTFSSEATRSFLERLLLSVPAHLSAGTVAVVHTLLRKGAHVLEYMVFGALVYFATGRPQSPIWSARPAGRTLLLVAAYALTDEVHQIFVRGRGPSPLDWAIDVAGATAAIGLLYAWSRLAVVRLTAPSSPA